MKEAPLKICLVGAGKMGGLHIDKLASNPDVRLVGVFDLDRVRAEKAVKTHGIPIFDSLDRLFFDAEAVWISSPTRTHFAIAKQALDLGLHVFVEKPICENLELAKQLVDLAAAKNKILQVGFLERHRVLQALKEYQIGQPVFIEAERFSVEPSRESGVDVVSDLMIHDIDLVLWLLREMPVSVSAVGRSLGISAIDVASARLEFPSGAIVDLSASWVAAQRHRRVGLFSQQGLIQFDLLAGRIDCFLRSDADFHRKSVNVSPTDALYEQTQSFVRAVRQGNEPFVSGADGLRAMEVVQEIQATVGSRNSTWAENQKESFELPWETREP